MSGARRMGPHRQKGDVCDAHGLVHGLTNVFIADASLMPSISTGNTNIPTALLGSRVGASVLAVTRDSR
jgi:choline dehydrogenase